MKYRKILCGLLFVCLLCGCHTIEIHRARPEYTVTVVLKALGSHYWLDMRSGMQQAAKELGIDLILLSPSGELENQEQQDFIADALQADTDILLFAPCDSYDTKWVVEAAAAKQIPVLTVDTRSLDADLPYIGSDNAQIGALAAEYLSSTLPDGGAVVIMAGSQQQASHIDRIDALRRCLDSRTQIAEIFYTDMTQTSGYNTIKKMAGQDFDAVFCANAVIGQGVAAGLLEMGCQAEIIAVDTQADAYQILEDGTMDALLSQDGYTIGYEAVAAAVHTLETGELPEDKLFASELLTSPGKEAAKT